MLRTFRKVLKGRNFHNRRSSTCGERSIHPLSLPERQDVARRVKSCLSDRFTGALLPAAGLSTCGYENFAFQAKETKPDAA
jgi:hypothetical protein